MKQTRTNLSINIQFNHVKEVERVLYQILNELETPANFGAGEINNISFNYVRERFTIEGLKNNLIIKTFKSKI